MTKAMGIESFIKTKIHKIEKMLAASEKVIEEFEMDHLMLQLHRGRRLADLSPTEIDKLISYSKNKIMCLKKKLGSTELPNASVNESSLGDEIPRALNVASEWPGNCNSSMGNGNGSFNLNVQPFDLNEEPSEEENEKT